MNDNAARLPFLERQPNMADLIAWVLALPAMFIGIIVCPYLLNVLPQFKAMFDALHGKLPTLTIFVLGNGSWFLTLLPLALVAGMVYVLMTSQNGWAKLIVAFVAGQMILTVAASTVLAIFYPIIVLQSAVRAGA